MCNTRKRLFSDAVDFPDFIKPDVKRRITSDKCRRSLNIQLDFPDKRTDIRPVKSPLGDKRPADDANIDETPTSKRLRQCMENLSFTNKAPVNSSIKDYVEKVVTKRDLVADGSREHILPTIPGKHGDLKSISAETMSDVLDGNYDAEFSRMTIVDCRYPYEYNGGHIRGAVNLYTKDDVHSLLKQPVYDDKPHILIFHCEFSSERGPKMYRFLRSEDRQLNKENYPKLNYPEVYLLHGGYKEFFMHKKNHCEPQAYKPMLHEDHVDDLRHFRRKSKSWTADETSSKSRRHFKVKSRSCLQF